MKLRKASCNAQEITLSKSEIVFLKKHLHKSILDIILTLLSFFIVYSFLFFTADKHGVSSIDNHGFFKVFSWLFLVTGTIAFLMIKYLKIYELKVDLKEKLKLRTHGTVKRAGSYKGEYYLILATGKPIRLRSRKQSFYHLCKGDKIEFEAYKNSSGFVYHHN
tara:strand:+ start:3095 stop:3583 length:489 start_codon:yes stop_codon:yes gene_type:complete